MDLATQVYLGPDIYTPGYETTREICLSELAIHITLSAVWCIPTVVHQQIAKTTWRKGTNPTGPSLFFSPLPYRIGNQPRHMGYCVMGFPKRIAKHTPHTKSNPLAEIP